MTLARASTVGEGIIFTLGSKFFMGKICNLWSGIIVKKHDINQFILFVLPVEFDYINQRLKLRSLQHLPVYHAFYIWQLFEVSFCSKFAITSLFLAYSLCSSASHFSVAMITFFSQFCFFYSDVKQMCVLCWHQSRLGEHIYVQGLPNFSHVL